MDAAPARPVVVGYDGSARSVAAVDWAAAHAHHHGAALTVLFAHDYPGYPAEAVGRAPAPPAAAVVSEAAKTADEGADRARARAARARGQRGAGLRRPVLGAGRGLRRGPAAGPRRPWPGRAARLPAGLRGAHGVHPRALPGGRRTGGERRVAGAGDAGGRRGGRLPRPPLPLLGFAADLAGEYDAPLVVLSIWRAPAKPPWGTREAAAGTREAVTAEGHRGRGPRPGRAAAQQAPPAEGRRERPRGTGRRRAGRGLPRSRGGRGGLPRPWRVPGPPARLDQPRPAPLRVVPGRRASAVRGRLRSWRCAPARGHAGRPVQGSGPVARIGWTNATCPLPSAQVADSIGPVRGLPPAC